jgi:hypothetical protein
MAFEPVQLVSPTGDKRTARTAAEEAKLRHDGWRTTPLKKKTAAKSDAPSGDKPDAPSGDKPAAKSGDKPPAKN